MMLRIGSGNYNSNNYNVRNTNRAQGRPAFGAITEDIADEIGQRHQLPDHEADNLIDMARAVKKYGPKALKTIRENAEKAEGDFQKAIKELLTHQD